MRTQTAIKICRGVPGVPHPAQNEAVFWLEWGFPEIYVHALEVGGHNKYFYS